MFRLLICLAAAMTMATGLLSWARPSSDRTWRHALERDWHAAVQAVIEDAEPASTLNVNTVDTIEVVTVHPRATRDLPAAFAPRRAASPARVPPSEMRFVVDSQGRLATDASPRVAGSAPANRRTLRVDVVRPDDARAISLRQWLCLRALINTINERSATAHRGVPVRLLGMSPTATPPLDVVRYAGADASLAGLELP